VNPNQTKDAVLWHGVDLELRVLIQANASKNEIINLIDNRLKIRVSAPANDNQANQRLIQYLSKQFGVAKANIEILKGYRSRKKTLFIKRPLKSPHRAIELPT